MSTDYYLFCRKHTVGVFITDDKGNPPDPDKVKQFLIDHVYKGCAIEFVNEHVYTDEKTKAYYAIKKEQEK